MPNDPYLAVIKVEIGQTLPENRAEDPRLVQETIDG
jgi:hypothetical protein